MAFGFRKPVPPPVRCMPPGERIYAIGDVHGCRDALDTLLALIDADDAARPAASTTLVFLGDLIDRGPDSRGVVERAMTLERRTVLLMGNHEEILLDAWEGDLRAGAMFMRIGGRETLASYGVDDVADLPRAHVAFIRRFADSHRAGDYLFVHAGVRPGVALAEQTPGDMRWIRRRFTESEFDHGVTVVHGHSTTLAVDERAHRVGIDTGAYATGRLTALGLEGPDRWFLSS